MDHKKLKQFVTVRRLYGSEHSKIYDHFLRLDAKARNARFGGAVSDRGIAHYTQDIFRDNSIIYGAFVEGTLCGVAELRGVFPMWPSPAEAAFSVEPDWQDLGIGDVLFESIVVVAQNRLVRSVRLMCQRANYRMWHLAKKHNAVVVFDQDMVDAAIYPRWPTPVSLVTEVWGRAAL